MSPRRTRRSFGLGCILVATIAATVYSQKAGDDAEPAIAAVSDEDEARVASILEMEPLVRAPGDNEPRWLLKQRLNAALRVLTAATEQFKRGVPGIDSDTLQNRFMDASHRVARCRLDLATRPAERIEVLEQMAALARDHERFVKANRGVGKGTALEVDLAQFERLDAEIRLLNERER